MVLKINNTFTRFITSGIINTLVGYFVFFICYKFIELSPAISNAISYAFGLVCSFILSATFVFSKTNQLRKRSIKFIICFFIAFMVNQLVLWFLSSSINIYFSQIFAMASYTIVFYILNKYFVFSS
ncbi:GtrA family protein [Kosakonia oryzae]|uniref:GtrA family protein n=1 Tax=Kosakonia oryzae TaxID=497725 RepID=UPI0007E2F385